MKAEASIKNWMYSHPTNFLPMFSFLVPDILTINGKIGMKLVEKEDKIDLIS